MMPRQKENPIVNILINIIIPVVILRNGSDWLNYVEINALKTHSDSFTFLIAILFPCIYFLYDLGQKKDINFIAIIGFINVLLTGYGGAGPYPQCFENLNFEQKTIAGKAKEKQFLIQATQFIDQIEPDYYLPFAGTYTLTGKLSQLHT